MSRPSALNLKAEDYQGLVQDYPEVERLLLRLNTFGTGVSGTLSKGLTLSDNVAAQIAEVEVGPTTDWVTVTYTNAWTTYSGDAAAQYVKLENGLVRLRGRIAPGSTGTSAFTLPEEYRPDRAIYMTTVTDATLAARVLVGTDGTVAVTYTGSPGWVALDAITFIAADRHPAVNDGTELSVKLSLPAGRRPQGVTVIRARDVTSKTETHVGNPVWVDWRDDGAQLVIEHMAGLAPGRRYKVRLLIWGA